MSNEESGWNADFVRAYLDGSDLSQAFDGLEDAFDHLTKDEFDALADDEKDDIFTTFTTNAQAAGVAVLSGESIDEELEERLAILCEDCDCGSSNSQIDPAYGKAEELFDKVVARAFCNKSCRPDIAPDTLGVITQVYDILEKEGLL